MNAIIVDDEPKAIELIRGYLDQFKSIEVIATFRNGLRAFEYINSNPVDLVFLDINMPHISGISLSKMLDKDIKIIFTTAYSDYAVESYEVAAVDYLLKPISMDRFMKAMTKIIEPSRVTTQTTPLPLWVKSGNKTYKLSIDDILYLRKDGNYLTYFTSTTKVMARESVGEALSKLPSFFVQCHKSHIINIRHITSFTKESVFINEIEISIGSSFRDNLTKVITEINN